MYSWQCPLCDETVSAAHQKNLNPLVTHHQKKECPFRDIPAEKRPLNEKDKKFLEELKVGW